VANDAPVLLDATRLIWRRWAGREFTGIDRVCRAYLKHFGRDAQAVVQHRRFRKILDRRSSQALFQMLDAPPRRFRASFVRFMSMQLPRSGQPGNGRLYLNIGHTGLDSAGFRRWVAGADVRPVYFVHDLIPITHPQFCRAGEAARHLERMRTVLATGCGVIANSRATLDDLARFADSEGLAQPPGVVAWLASPHLQPQAQSADVSERPAFVVVGTIEARKNHLLLLRVWRRLVERLGAGAPRLMIIGQRGWEADEVFDILNRDQTLREHVVEVNDCSDTRLAWHLANARALLFPSWAEGFGLPLVEALGFGCPAIASDLPAFREIGQGVPVFLDPAEEERWEAAILEFAQPQSAARAAQLERLRHFRAPDWQMHFDRVEQWLPTLDPGADVRGSTRSRS
jgi:glycosyltransferase involved in cell wall biosynthesis